MNSPLELSAPLASKLGSVVVHVEEMLSPTGHDFDRIALEGLLADPDIREWITDLQAMALVPVKR